MWMMLLGRWLVARMADLTMDFVDTTMVFMTVVFVESPVLAVLLGWWRGDYIAVLFQFCQF